MSFTTAVKVAALAKMNEAIQLLTDATPSDELEQQIATLTQQRDAALQTVGERNQEITALNTSLENQELRITNAGVALDAADAAIQQAKAALVGAAPAEG